MIKCVKKLIDENDVVMRSYRKIILVINMSHNNERMNKLKISNDR
jgi:hypothetical protein